MKGLKFQLLTLLMLLAQPSASFADYTWEHYIFDVKIITYNTECQDGNAFCKTKEVETKKSEESITVFSKDGKAFLSQMCLR